MLHLNGWDQLPCCFAVQATPRDYSAHATSDVQWFIGCREAPGIARTLLVGGVASVDICLLFAQSYFACCHD